MLKKDPIRKIYLYLFTIIGLVLIIIGTVGIVNLFLKAVIFTQADNDYIYEPIILEENATKNDTSLERINYRQAQNQRDAARNIAMLIVGLPLYLYHWSRIRKEQ